MKKFLICFFAISLIAVCTSCTNQKSSRPAPQQTLEKTEQNAAESENNLSNQTNLPTEALQQESRITSPDFGEGIATPITTLDVYRFWEDGQTYSHEKVDLSDGKQNYLAALDAAASVFSFIKEPLPVQSIILEKSNLTIDFEEKLIEQYDKHQLFELQNTVATTFFRNNLCESICFSLNGDKNILGGVNYQPSPFNLAEQNTEDLQKVINEIPYQGISDVYMKASKERYQNSFGITMDDNQLEIAKYLSFLGKLEGSASSPEELDMGRLVFHGIFNSTKYSIRDDANPDIIHLPQLQKISDALYSKMGFYETEFTIANHVEKNIQYLLGDDFQVDLSRAEDLGYHYFPEEGVITPPHSDGGYDIYPIVKDYQETDGIIKADILYLFESMNGFFAWDQPAFENDAQMKDYIEHSNNIVSVTLKRGTDGRLFFQNCRFPNK